MTYQTLRPLLAALMLIAPPAANADATTPATLAQILRDKSGAPGVGVGWIRDGQVAIAVAGVRARGTNVAVSPQDLWHIGSNAKSMTATLVARLVEAGVVGWDDTIAQHLQDMDIDPGFRGVTFAQLLAHRSGLPANPSLWFLRKLDGRDVVAERRALAGEMLARTPKTPPGHSFVYSNAGYVIAGAMLESATAQSWEDLMQDWVFEPLGMESAGFGAPGTAQTLSQPRGHGGVFPWSRAAVAPGPKADNVPALGPAGTVHLSLQDHLRYLHAQMIQTSGFLSQSSWSRLHSDVDDQGYALGWAVRDDGILAHNGSNTMWFNMVLVDRKRRRAVVLALNEAAMARVGPATAEVAQMFFALPPSDP